jgi:uncharacterized protein (DUF433 family)
MSARTRTYPYIIRDPDICFGQPCIEGTRIRVLDIAIEYDRLGRSPDQIAEAHPGLTLAQIHAALTYYYEHMEEIDQAIRAERGLAERVQGQMVTG